MLLGTALLISIGLGIFVAAPLFAPMTAGEGTLPIDVTPLADLKRRRLVVYENLQDLEFEYRAGKIAENDYQALRENYLAEAAGLMADSLAVENLGADEVFIEREVAARRARRKLQPTEEYVCAKCGFENPLPVKFCGECGARVAPRSRKS